MFDISLRISKPKSSLSTSSLKSISLKNKSKFLNSISSFFKPKVDSPNIDLDRVSIESTKVPTLISKFSTVPSFLDNLPLKEKEFILNFYQISKKIINQIPVGLGIFGGMYAINQIFFVNNNLFSEDLESLECFLIVY